ATGRIGGRKDPADERASRLAIERGKGRRRHDEGEDGHGAEPQGYRDDRRISQRGGAHRPEAAFRVERAGADTRQRSLMRLTIPALPPRFKPAGPRTRRAHGGAAGCGEARALRDPRAAPGPWAFRAPWERGRTGGR